MALGLGATPHALTSQFRSLKPTREVREMLLLSQIADDAHTTQRELARAAGISAAMVNTYLADLVDQGSIRVEGESHRSMSYRLTDAGRIRMRELAELTAKEVVQFYGRLKQFFLSRLMSAGLPNNANVVLWGAAETGELVLGIAGKADLNVVGVVDSDASKHGHDFGGLKVQSPDRPVSADVDAVIITSFGHGDEIEEQCRQLGLSEKGIGVVRL